jgi:dihydroorotate dehydrogenase
MSNLYCILRPVIFKIEPEKAHNMTLSLMKSGLLPHCKAIESEALSNEVFGLNFSNPVGLSAGFDKNAEVVGESINMGFGFVEAGTVTPQPQMGNEKPRIFRDPSNEAVINRMGFPNDGMHVFKKNLEEFRRKEPTQKAIVGVNIGINKTQTEPAKDYGTLIHELSPLADYITVNISSPNTPGLRDLQKREALLEIIKVIKDQRGKTCSASPPPLLIKLAPDLNMAQQEELAATLLEAKVDGVILSNTTIDRPTSLSQPFADQKGGLSGMPVREKSTQIISNFYKLTKGQLKIIGVGGISNGEHAYEKIKAGASLVQLYTGLIFKGPNIANTINKQLLECFKKDGVEHISQVIGIDHR